jgi:sugar transferase (PEP-CTERM/EpsH1 system associated)
VNILFLVHRAPYPPDKGDRIRSFHLLKRLAALGRVHLATFADEPVSESSLAALKALTARLEIVPWDRRQWLKAGVSVLAGRSATEGFFASRSLRATLRRWTGETAFDVGIAFCSSMAGYLEPLPLRSQFVDLVDVDSEKFFQYAERAPFPRRTLYAIEGRRLRVLEQRIGTTADRVALATEPEAALYRTIAPEARALAIPNGVDLDYFQWTPAAPDADVCMFLGALDYRANIEGVAWFAECVWPEVRRRRHDARFLVVGRRPASAVRSLDAQPGIEIVGEVPDVRPFLARSTVTVAPLRVARGVQNKVLESMAVGRSVLASPEAAIGLNVIDGSEVLLARSAGEWVERLLRLWDESELRGRLTHAARRYVETHHAWDACLAPWADWLKEAVRRSDRTPRTSALVGEGFA